MRPGRLDLARLPTPLEPMARLQERWGGPRLWVKRDDLTGFELSGNKVRKLEYHLAAAVAEGADWVITAGAEQSNHCRATALAAARLGLGCTLVIRVPGGTAPERVVANHRAHVVSGARIVYTDRDGWSRLDQLVEGIGADLVAEGHRPWSIPVGASDALGMLGMADAMIELGGQLGEAGIERPTVWHASSSAGTTAGFGWGADEAGLTASIVACSVDEPAERLRRTVEEIWEDATDRFGGTVPTVPIEYRDDYVGEGYGRIDEAQHAVVIEAVGATGLLFDPTYTGKALYGLCQEIDTGRWGPDEDVIFWHTGGGFMGLV